MILAVATSVHSRTSATYKKTLSMIKALSHITVEVTHVNESGEVSVEDEEQQGLLADHGHDHGHDDDHHGHSHEHGGHDHGHGHGHAHTGGVDHDHGHGHDNGHDHGHGHGHSH